MTADQLRKSILQQAIQGKLVSQDPNDEPASVLLERIREEKARLVEEKKIKKEKNPSVIFRGEDNSYYEKFTLSGEVKCIDEEIPFEIPNGWEWTRISNIFQINPKNICNDELEVAFIPMEKLSAGYGSNYSYEKVKWSKIKKGFTHFANGDIAFAKITPCFQNRKSAVFDKLPNGIGAGTTELKTLRTFAETINRFYLLYFLKSPYFIEGAIFKGTANQQRIISGYLENKLFPLPPLKEQQRIVEKIEELIPHIELYGKAQTELDTLNKNIKEQLKKSVLQYAIEGKLVPQDEAEGSAEELLLQIQAEKQKLYEENKLKKKDLEHSTIFKDEDNKYYEKIGKNVICIDEEIPFEIPKDWRWCRLGVLTIFLSRGKSPKYSEIKKYPVFAQKCNLKSGKLSLDAAKFLDERTLSKWRDEYKLRNNDILINSTGTGTVGRVGIFSEQILRNYPFIVPDSHISVVRTFSNIDSYYIYYLMCSSIIQQYIEDNLAGSTNQKELYIGVLEKLLLPLPPLSEQQRIVNTIQNIFRCIEN